MTADALRAAAPAEAAPGLDGLQLLDGLADAVLLLDGDDRIAHANLAAQEFLRHALPPLLGRRFADLLARDAPLVALIARAREAGQAFHDGALEIALRHGDAGIHDVSVMPHGAGTLTTIRERTLSDRLGHRDISRGAVRSMTGLAATLAHEVRNPLSGIRGAAQLLAPTVDEEGRALTGLIADEVDRICALLDRMESFSDRHPMPRSPVNIHAVLDHVVRLARAGFARDATIVEAYDPSLPVIEGNRDALVQAMLNLVKNAAEACGEGGRITVSTGYEPGLRLAGPGGGRRLVPLVVTIADDGPGVPEHIAEFLFDPFVTARPGGIGLGLSMVAKIVEDHGGVVSSTSRPGDTRFRVALPLPAQGAAR